jgi:hypothetical protein
VAFWVNTNPHTAQPMAEGGENTAFANKTLQSFRYAPLQAELFVNIGQ